LVRPATALTFRDVLLLDDRRERQIQIDFVPPLGIRRTSRPGAAPPRGVEPLGRAPARRAGELAVMFARFCLALT
jgi:hypothetical protein